MRELRDEAVVLRTYRSGEADRIVVFYTAQHGKIRAIAKGVRKGSSRIGSGLEPLAEVDAYLVSGRSDLQIVRHISHRAQHKVLRSAYERIAAAMAVVEVVDSLSVEGAPDEELFTLLSRVLSTLDDETIRPDLVPSAFYLRLLAHDGSQPVVDCCVSCSSPGPLVSFDAQVGGTLCVDCRTGRAVSAEGLELLQRMVGGDLARVLREVSPAQGEVAALALEAIEGHVGRRLRATRSTATA